MEDDDLGLGLSDDDEPVVSAPAKVAPALTGPGIVSTAKPKELRAEVLAMLLALPLKQLFIMRVIRNGSIMSS